MLQNIKDNSQGWIAKSIIGVIVLLLALTGFEALFQSTSNKQVAAEVNGKEITQNELARAIEMQRRQLQQQLGSSFDDSLLDEGMLRAAALKGLIDRKLLMQGVEDSNFAFSTVGIDQIILQIPEFQVDGRFDSNRFDMVLRQTGYDRIQFRQMLTQDLLLGQLRAAVAGASFTTDEEVQAFVALAQQTRDFAFLAFDADASAVTVTDEEVNAYYDQRTLEFMTPEQVVLEYVKLRKEQFFDQVVVTDEALQDLYEAEIANLVEQRRAAHILVEVGDDVRTLQEAQSRVAEIEARLGKGEDFAVLAREFSDDLGSAEDGGDLGYAGPDVYEPAFEEAVYQLQVEQVSKPIETPYGIHLIKLLGVQAPEKPTFSSLREKLERDYKEQQVELLFVDASKKLEDLAYEASDLMQPAQELGLSIEVTPPFGREGGTDGVAANRQVVQAAFSQEVLEDAANSAKIELDPSTVVVVRLKEHLKSRQLSLLEASESIRDYLRYEKAAEHAKLRGQQAMQDILAGSQLDGWQKIEAAARNQGSVDPKIMREIFRMPHPGADAQPSYAGLALDNGDYAVLRLDGVSQPTDEVLSAEMLSQYRNILASRKGQQDFSAYRKYLEQKAKIERF